MVACRRLHARRPRGRTRRLRVGHDAREPPRDSAVRRRPGPLADPRDGDGPPARLLAGREVDPLLVRPLGPARPLDDVEGDRGSPARDRRRRKGLGPFLQPRRSPDPLELRSDGTVRDLDVGRGRHRRPAPVARGIGGREPGPHAGRVDPPLGLPAPGAGRDLAVPVGRVRRRDPRARPDAAAAGGLSRRSLRGFPRGLRVRSESGPRRQACRRSGGLFDLFRGRRRIGGSGGRPFALDARRAHRLPGARRSGGGGRLRPGRRAGPGHVRLAPQARRLRPGRSRRVVRNLSRRDVDHDRREGEPRRASCSPSPSPASRRPAGRSSGRPLSRTPSSAAPAPAPRVPRRCRP